MQPYGIAQVFTCPHPYKITDKRNFHSEKLPKFSVHKGQSSQVLNEKRMSITKLSDPVNEQVIQKSKYNISMENLYPDLQIYPN